MQPITSSGNGPDAPAENHVAGLIERNFGSSDGTLLVGGIPVSKLAARHGTPFFAYDAALFDRQWSRLRETYPERFDLYYSIKANPCQALLRRFVARGTGLEIASAGELAQARAADCPAHRILFAGPGKTEAELKAALDAGIGEIHVESLTEGRRIAALAGSRGKRAAVALRVNPSAAVAGGGMRMGGKPVAFGIDEDQLDEVTDHLLREPALEIVGLHLFMGTQIPDHEVLLLQYRAGLGIASRLVHKLGKNLTTIDFGGGLGIPYFPHEQPLDLAQLATGLRDFAREADQMPELEGTRFIVEPGRFLAAEAGVYVACVTDVKTSRGKTFVITDGGMHHHLAASGNLGQTIKRNFPVALVNGLDREAAAQVDVVGPLCTPLDVLARDIHLPEVAVGDLIGVFQSGAYARAASPLGFLSRQAPPEILVGGGQDHLVRRRGADEDYLSDQLDLT
jgi:diaminopimelate decarboxylase